MAKDVDTLIKADILLLIAMGIDETNLNRFEDSFVEMEYTGDVVHVVAGRHRYFKINLEETTEDHYFDVNEYEAKIREDEGEDEMPVIYKCDF